MKNRTRFQRLMTFQSVDRLPLVEWAGWWDVTLDRWRTEGLPKSLKGDGAIREFLGLDAYRQHWILPYGPGVRAPEGHGRGICRNLDEYKAVKPQLFPVECVNEATVHRWAEAQERGDLVVWITLEGFFWFPRALLGIQNHLHAFYDQPETIHAINGDLVEFNLRALDDFCAICTPDFMTFAEDMSYNHGPMISKRLFDEFLAPYHRRIVPRIRERGIVPFVDTDGNVERLVPWFTDLGIEGFLPLERRAGNDVATLRRRDPRLKTIGGFDKTCMTGGERVLRAEFERLLPEMRRGGFIPSVDHQTPPDVSLKNYRLYVRLLREYCEEAACGWIGDSNTPKRE